MHLGIVPQRLIFTTPFSTGTFPAPASSVVMDYAASPKLSLGKPSATDTSMYSTGPTVLQANFCITTHTADPN